MEIIPSDHKDIENVRKSVAKHINTDDRHLMKDGEVCRYTIAETSDNSAKTSL
jgi:hypothetical protein